MSNLFRPFQLPQATLPDTVIAFEMTRNFYREVEYREEQVEYCQWYRRIAQQHQQEFAKMQQDMNVLGWFRHRSRR
jgi:hypothetical protein